MTNRPDFEQLNQLRGLCPGRWNNITSTVDGYRAFLGADTNTVDGDDEFAYATAFIVRAHDAMPDIFAYVTELEEELKDARFQLEASMTKHVADLRQSSDTLQQLNATNANLLDLIKRAQAVADAYRDLAEKAINGASVPSTVEPSQAS